jgi:RNA polymerase sigma-70 factor (ECF subfamily)
MFNTAMRILNNREEAEDVLQESFIAAFKNIQQYSGKFSFGSWLKRIVINRSIDALKKRNLNLVSLEEKEIAQPENEITEASFLSIEAIKEAVKELPDGYRLVITLYLFEDYSHKKISEQLNISEGTSKSQYARARKKLMELIRLRTGNNE